MWTVRLLIIAVCCLFGSSARAASGWLLFDVKGKAELRVKDAAPINLTREKNLLMAIKPGAKVLVHGKGRLVLVSAVTNTAFELLDNTEAIVTDTEVKAIKGVVRNRKGYSVPRKESGQIAGVVIRGNEREQCLQIVSQQYTAYHTLTPDLRWTNSCESGPGVTLTLLAEGRVILRKEHLESSLKIPEGLLDYGKRYTWLLSSDNGLETAAAAFTTLSGETARLVGKRLQAMRKNPEDVSERLSLIFFLQENGLIELVSDEIAVLKNSYPQAEGVRDNFR